MRLNQASTIHTLALYLLPPLVAWLGLGPLAAVVVSAVAVLVGMALRFPDVLDQDTADRIELHTITYSHYVEKVRWCLDATGLPYKEVPSIGILGLLLTGRTVPLLELPASRTSIGDSPKILRFLWGAYSASLPPERSRFLEPTAEGLELEAKFDRVLGVHVRVWAYWHLFQNKALTLRMWGMYEDSVPTWQRRLLPVLQPLLAKMVQRVLGVTAVGAERSLAITRQAFAEVDAMLADGRRYLLGGSEKTFVDITFASLAALAIFPPGYGGASVSQKEPPLDLLSSDWRAVVEELRATPAGQFVIRLYTEERLVG